MEANTSWGRTGPPPRQASQPNTPLRSALDGLRRGPGATTGLRLSVGRQVWTALIGSRLPPTSAVADLDHSPCASAFSAAASQVVCSLRGTAQNMARPQLDSLVAHRQRSGYVETLADTRLRVASPCVSPRRREVGHRTDAFGQIRLRLYRTVMREHRTVICFCAAASQNCGAATRNGHRDDHAPCRGTIRPRTSKKRLESKR